MHYNSKLRFTANEIPRALETSSLCGTQVGIKRLGTKSEHRVAEEYTEELKMGVHCCSGAEINNESSFLHLILLPTLNDHYRSVWGETFCK